VIGLVHAPSTPAAAATLVVEEIEARVASVLGRDKLGRLVAESVAT
jgi:hypothetical protein